MADLLPDDLEGCCLNDLDFHERIIAAAGNIFLARFAAVIRTALRTSFLVSYDARELYENSLSEHWAVIDAISKRMPGEAERAMRFLLKGTARDLAPAFPHIKPEQGASAAAAARTTHGRAPQGGVGAQAPVTRQITSPTSSATSSEPSGPSVTPTGRP